MKASMLILRSIRSAESKRPAMKQIIFGFLITLLLWPSLSQAGQTRVYVGFSVGTAIVVGSGIASFNVGVNQRVSGREPQSDTTEPDPPPALVELNREEETVLPKTFPDFRINAQPDSPQPLLLELPLLILRW